MTDRATQRVRSAVDRLLLEQGEYQPLELLLQLGRLPYRRYEGWRQGDPGCLEDALAGDRTRVAEALAAAAQWAVTLALKAEPLTYHGWGSRAGQALCLSRDPALERLLATGYRKPQRDSGQLDLFLDAGPTPRLNALMEALVQRRPEAARQALEALARHHPQHPRLPAGEALCDALDHLAAAGPPADPQSEVMGLDGRLAPDAQALLGGRARDFLAPFRRRLADAMDPRAWDPERGEVHPSRLYAQCLDWEAAQASVLATPAWEDRPALVASLAEARYRLGARPAALALWFRLCWEVPEVAEALLADPAFPDPALQAAWNAFRDLDLEPGPDLPWLPAWLLLREPHLTLDLDVDAVPDRPGPTRAFRLLHALLQPGGGDDMALRRALKAEHPGLFRAYLHTYA
jgi:hypothetical protein